MPTRRAITDDAQPLPVKIQDHDELPQLDHRPPSRHCGRDHRTTRRPASRGAPRKAGHHTWGIFKRRFWGESLRRSHWIRRQVASCAAISDANLWVAAPPGNPDNLAASCHGSISNRARAERTLSSIPLPSSPMGAIKIVELWSKVSDELWPPAEPLDAPVLFTAAGDQRAAAQPQGVSSASRLLGQLLTSLLSTSVR